MKNCSKYSWRSTDLLLLLIIFFSLPVFANRLTFVRSESKSISEGESGCVIEAFFSGIRRFGLVLLALFFGWIYRGLLVAFRLLNVLIRSMSEASEFESQSSESQWLVPGDAVFESDF